MFSAICSSCAFYKKGQSNFCALNIPERAKKENPKMTIVEKDGDFLLNNFACRYITGKWEYENKTLEEQIDLVKVDKSIRIGAVVYINSQATSEIDIKKLEQFDEVVIVNSLSNKNNYLNIRKQILGNNKFTLTQILASKDVLSIEDEWSEGGKKIGARIDFVTKIFSIGEIPNNYVEKLKEYLNDNVGRGLLIYYDDIPTMQRLLLDEISWASPVQTDSGKTISTIIEKIKFMVLMENANWAIVTL